MDRPQRPDAPGSIRGVVTDHQGRTIPDVTIIIRTSDRPHPDIAAVTDAEGCFTFPDLLPGSYVLAAFGAEPSGAEVSVRVEPGTAARVGFVIRRAG